MFVSPVVITVEILYLFFLSLSPLLSLFRTHTNQIAYKFVYLNVFITILEDGGNAKRFLQVGKCCCS